MDSGRRSNMSDMTINEDGFFPEDPIENPDFSAPTSTKENVPRKKKAAKKSKKKRDDDIDILAEIKKFFRRKSPISLLDSNQ